MRQSQISFNLLSSLIGRRNCGGYNFKALRTLSTVSLRRDATTLLQSGGLVFPSCKVIFKLNHCSLKDISPKRYKMSEAGSQQSSSTAAAGTNGAGADRSKCVFCKIVDGKEENEIFYQDDEIVVFQDIKPAAKHHLLVVTREHIRDCKSLFPSQLGLLERLIQTGNKVLLECIQKESPETVNLDNIEKRLGFHWPPFHTVSHLHLHVIAPSNEMGFIAKTIFRPDSYWFVTPEYVKNCLQMEKKAEDDKQGGNNAT